MFANGSQYRFNCGSTCCGDIANRIGTRAVVNRVLTKDCVVNNSRPIVQVWTKINSNVCRVDYLVSY